MVARTYTFRIAFVFCIATLWLALSPELHAAPDKVTADPVARAMHQGRYREALRMLAARGDTANYSPDRIRIALCYLRLGESRTADSLLAIAPVADYQRMYVDYWRALAVHQSGDSDAAARQLDLLADNARSPVADSAAVWALRTASAAGNELLVAKAIDRLVGRDDDAAAYGLLVRMQQAAPGWQTSWNRLRTQLPGTQSALDGVKIADSLGWTPQGEEWIELARLFERHNQTQDAVGAWRSAIDGPLSAERIVYSRFHLARLLSNTGEQSPAAEQIRAILDDDSATGWHPRSLRLLASVERRRNRETRSREIEQEFQRRFPDHDDVAASMWQVAMSLERTRNLSAAIKEHERLATQFPGTNLGDEASWRIGLIHYRQGHYYRAHRQFARVVKSAEHWVIHDQAAYWAGKSLRADGRTVEAQQMWERAAVYSPRSYYSVLAALVSNRPIVPPEDERPVKTGPHRRPADWPGFEEAVWLASAGESRWAREVFTLRTRGLAGRVNEREELADAFEAMGDYYMSLRWRWRAMWGRITEDRYHELSPDLLRRIWPDFFAHDVTAAAKRYDLDPALLWAIIRQESVFDPDATSFADARGLMQIIPRTGHALARELGIEDFHENDLYDPALNIRMGSHYAHQLMQQFGNKVDHMAAGYNAGPSNVDRWRRAAGDDHDLYRELITYSETRKYVKLVLRNYLIYRELYPDRQAYDGGT